MPIFLICFSLSAIATSLGQFASGVNLVEVYATVVDARGQAVEGLPADAFAVAEDGQRQEIKTFAAGELPLALAIAVDRSFSMASDRLAHVTAAAQGLLSELRPADQVMVLGVGSQVEVLSPLSGDHRAAYDALLDLRPWGTTPLYDATVQAIDAVQPASGRRALLLISDGGERYSEASAAAMLAHARGHDVQVYPVTLGRTQPPVLVELGTLTGGRAVRVNELSALPATLSALARELRSQYLLGYVPPRGPGGRTGWRSITVEVRRPGVRVRARDGYMVR